MSWPQDHPHCNPRHRDYGRRGYLQIVEERKDDKGRRFNVITIRDFSRWMPHQGERECARRRRRMERR